MTNNFVIAGRKAPTGLRKARPDDKLRAVFAPEDPAIHKAAPRLWRFSMDARVKPAHDEEVNLNRFLNAPNRRRNGRVQLLELTPLLSIAGKGASHVPF